jgi:GNAT superfamily N-acetyltransferase
VLRQRLGLVPGGIPVTPAADQGSRGEVAVRPARATDLRFVSSVGWPDAHAIGFFPRVVYERAIAGDTPDYRIWVAEANGDQVGFLYATPGVSGGVGRIAQAWVRADARRVEYGRALTQTAERWFQARWRHGVVVRVASELEGRQFWAALGYGVVGTEPGGARRHRTIERRYKSLANGLWMPAELSA